MAATAAPEAPEAASNAPEQATLAETRIRRRRFTADEFERMGQAGILDEDDRLELLDGEIVEMSPIGPRHIGGVNRLTATFASRVGRRATVSVQNPIRLDEHWEPQPDVTLLRRRRDGYARAKPTAADVLLIVEVSDTSGDYDRTVKLRRYAGARIPETWVLNLTGAHELITPEAQGEPVLEVYRKPIAGGYTEVRLLRRGDRIAPEALPDVEIPVDELLDEESDEQAASEASEGSGDTRA